MDDFITNNINNIIIFILVYLFILISGGAILFFSRPKDENKVDSVVEDIEKAEQRELDRSKEDGENERNLLYYYHASKILTKHFESNLNQNQQIYQLTVTIIKAGWIIIIAGIFVIIFDILVPSEKENPVNYSWLPIFAGIITEFIAATVLLVYKSVSQQTIEYFHALERFSTVGVSIGILDNIGNDIITDKLKPVIDKIKIETKADVAKLLIQLNKDVTTSSNGTDREKST